MSEDFSYDSEPGVSFEELPPMPASVAADSIPEPLPPAAPPLSGVVEKNVPSQPSQVEAAAPAEELPPDPADAFESKSGVEEYYYDESSARFWLKNEAGLWVHVSEAGFKRHLKKAGKRDKPAPGKIISPLEEEVSRIEKECRVAYAGLLAGYKQGIHMVAGRRVLVSESFTLIEPVKGEWPVIEKIFEGLFVGREMLDDKGKFEEIDQRPWVFGWLRHTVECLREGRTSPGLALGIAGDPNCGKSFFALILRWLLGDRVGKPYAAMTGQDNFNRDAAEAVLQLVDDENQSDTRLDMRQKFASEIKKFNANNEFRLRSMHKDGFAVEVLRRLVILVNMQGIFVLPPLDGDVDDKIMLVRGYARPRPEYPITTDTPYDLACWPSPMPTRTEVEREAYRDRVRAELPAFLFWLLYEWRMPSQVSGGRFVVRHWHHPQIVAALHEMSPHTRLWDLIVRSKCVFMKSLYDLAGGTTTWETVSEWSGSAGDLEQLLKGDKSKLSDAEKREIPASNWLGRRLELCERHFGREVCQFTGGRTKRLWVLHPRAQDTEVIT